MASSEIHIPAQRKPRPPSTVGILRMLGSSGPIVSEGFDLVDADQLGVIRAITETSLRFIVPSITGPIDEDTVDAAVLLTSEIAANGIKHTSGLAYLEIRAAVGAFAISVGDYGMPGKSLQIDRRHSAPSDESGRGLEIVEALSTIWGRDEDGQETWLVMMPEPPEAHLQQPEKLLRLMADVAM